MDWKNVQYKDGKMRTSEGGGGGSSHDYSTTEQVIGTWTDGKTLYERTINETCANSSADQTIVNFTSERVRTYEGVYFQNSSGDIIDAWWSTTNFWTWVITNSGIIVHRNTSDPTWQSNVNFHMVIRYTKTTD